MEALSLIGGIIAVAQAGDRLISLLNKIRPLFDAPKSINLLISEIFSFKAILVDLKTVLDHDARSVPSQLNNNINKNIQQGSEVLIEIETLVNVSFTKLRGAESDKRKFNRIAWTKKLHEVEHLRQRLKDVKLNILVQLGAIQTMRHSQVTQNIETVANSIDNIAHTVAARISEQLELQLSIRQRFDTLSAQIATLLDHSIATDQSGDTGSVYSPAENGHSNTSAIEVELPGFSPQLASLRALKLRVEQHYYCNSSCSCNCHNRSHIATPKMASSFIGSLSISWSLLDSYRKSCNEELCHMRSKSLFDLQYQFPRWFLARIMFLSFFFSRKKGPEFIVRVLRIRPYSAEIFRFVKSDDATGVHRLITTDRASLLDVDQYFHGSLLAHALSGPGPICLNVAKYLILSGANLFQEEKSGRTPFDIIWTEIFETSPSATQLQPLVPNLNVMDRDEFTIFHKIILQLHGGNLENELTAAQVDTINSKDMWGRTPLMWAAIRGDVRSTLLLLQAGADPNIRDGHGFSPFDTLIYSKRAICALTLLNSGADVISGNPRDGETIMQLVGSLPDSVGELLEPTGKIAIDGIDTDTRNCVAAELLDWGVDIDASTSFDNNALIGSIIYNHHRLADLLLHRGADFRYINRLGHSILHAAAKYGNIETLRMLLLHTLRGLRIDSKARDGKTALDYVEERIGVDQEWLVVWQELIGNIMEADKNRSEDGSLHDDIDCAQNYRMEKVDVILDDYGDDDGVDDDGVDDEVFRDALEEFQE